MCCNRAWVASCQGGCGKGCPRCRPPRAHLSICATKRAWIGVTSLQDCEAGRLYLHDREPDPGHFRIDPATLAPALEWLPPQSYPILCQILSASRLAMQQQAAKAQCSQAITPQSPGPYSINCNFKISDTVQGRSATTVPWKLSSLMGGGVWGLMAIAITT